VKAYLHRCKALLKQLGMLNDAVVAVALADRLCGSRRAELAPAVAALAAWAANSQDKARRHIQESWHAFTSAPLPK
jgi:CHAD domain-containing protein